MAASASRLLRGPICGYASNLLVRYDLKECEFALCLIETTSFAHKLLCTLIYSAGQWTTSGGWDLLEPRHQAYTAVVNTTFSSRAWQVRPLLPPLQAATDKRQSLALETIATSVEVRCTLHMCAAEATALRRQQQQLLALAYASPVLRTDTPPPATLPA